MPFHLCEIKFCNHEFEVSREYANTLNLRRALFQKETKTRKALFNTLITPQGAKENAHFHGSVDEQLTIDALFTPSVRKKRGSV